MSIKVIILCGGSGTRFSNKKKKQIFVLDKVPIVVRSIVPFENNPLIDEIVIASEPSLIGKINEFINKFSLHKVSRVVEGGKTSIDSCFFGLNALSNLENGDKIIIHEAVRPFVTESEITSLINCSVGFKCGCCVSECYESIIFKEQINNIHEQVDRNLFYRIHMPQIYSFDVLKRIQKELQTNGKEFTSINLAAHFFGYDFAVSPCSKWNIKITTKEDFDYAKHVAKVFQKGE